MATAEQKARYICEEVRENETKIITKFKIIRFFQIAADPQTDSKTQLIIACDTVVTLDGEIIEKPGDKQHAFEMLKR